MTMNTLTERITQGYTAADATSDGPNGEYGLPEYDADEPDATPAPRPADMTPDAFQRRIRRDCPGLMVSGVTGTTTFSVGFGDRDEPAVAGWSALVLPVNAAYEKVRAPTLEGLAEKVVEWWRERVGAGVTAREGR